MITVIDYGLGNVGSIVNMGKRAGGQMEVSVDPEVIRRSDKLILPGVGAFDRGMQRLQERNLIELLHEVVVEGKKPILGICLGVQLFTRGSDEGHLPGLGWVPARTVAFDLSSSPKKLAIPHMGWNSVTPSRQDPLFGNLSSEARFYFVHSFHLQCDDPSLPLGWSDYGLRFASAIRQDNIWGTQFHPEKSHKFGLQLMRNFINI